MKDLKELKQVNFGSNTITLKDNLVSTGILPKNTAELDQSITVDSNVIVEGPIYANSIEINNGPADFKKAVFASKELHVKNDSTGLLYFYKSLASSGSIVALLASSYCIFGADINAPSIKLKNCFVAGSIYGTEVQLENTVVLGGVFATKKLLINSCMLGTFNAPEVNANGINYLLYPTAFSVEPMSFLPGTEFWNLSLADLGSLYKGEPEKLHTGKIKMDMVHDTQTSVLNADDGTKTLVNSYSIASRVLVSDLVNLDKLENHFLIISGSLGSQVLKQYSLVKSNGEKTDPLSVDKIANFLFEVLNAHIKVHEISGEVSFDELKKSFA